jgi:hypothetical protein
MSKADDDVSMHRRVAATVPASAAPALRDKLDGAGRFKRYPCSPTSARRRFDSASNSSAPLIPKTDTVSGFSPERASCIRR